MTDLFKQAVDTVSKLPDDQQDRIAALMLSAVKGKRPPGLARGPERVPDDFNESLEQESSVTYRRWIGGRKPTQEETARAMDRWRELRKGITLGDDLTIRELIDAGRR